MASQGLASQNGLLSVSQWKGHVALELALAEWTSAETDMLMYLRGHLWTGLWRSGAVMEAQVTTKAMHQGPVSPIPPGLVSLWPGELTLPLVFLCSQGMFIQKASSAQKTWGKKASPTQPSGTRKALACSPQIHRGRICQTFSKCQVEEWITAHQ